MKVVTKIGDVFCVEIDNKYKQFFQYIAKDKSQLNSSVIRVFDNRYPIEYIPLINDIVNDGILFYAHTILKVGIENNAWYKIGSCKELGDTDNIMFRLKGVNWYVWRINDSYHDIDRLSEEYIEYNIGYVFPYLDIVEKIKTGRFVNEHLIGVQ